MDAPGGRGGDLNRDARGRRSSGTFTLRLRATLHQHHDQQQRKPYAYRDPGPESAFPCHLGRYLRGYWGGRRGTTGGAIGGGIGGGICEAESTPCGMVGGAV